VGLVNDLQCRLSSLEEIFPRITESMYPVSCEEIIEDPETYCSGSFPPFASCEKEHLLLCVSFAVEERHGVMLMDPGYHVAEPIVVMEDGRFPQSPPYQARNGKDVKTYSYRYHEGNPYFVEWNARNGDEYRTNLIYINRPFLSGLDNAERRNLIYPVKSIINREENGDIRSGLYLALKLEGEHQVAFFTQCGDGSMGKVRIPLQYFVSNSSLLSDDSYAEYECQSVYVNNIEWNKIIERVCNDAKRGDQICRVLKFVATVFHENPAFLHELKEINDRIVEFSDMN